MVELVVNSLAEPIFPDPVLWNQIFVSIICMRDTLTVFKNSVPTANNQKTATKNPKGPTVKLHLETGHLTCTAPTQTTLAYQSLLAITAQIYHYTACTYYLKHDYNVLVI